MPSVDDFLDSVEKGASTKKNSADAFLDSPSEQPKNDSVDPSKIKEPSVASLIPKGDNSGFLVGAKRGLMERGAGVDQTLNELGVGPYIPLYVDGKLHVGLPSNEDLADFKKTSEKSGEGTGAKGWLGEVAGDPTSYLPWSKQMGIVKSGAINAGLSGVLAPSKDKDQTLGERATGGAASSVIGATGGKVLDFVGGKLADKLGIGDFASKLPKKASDLYGKAKAAGLEITEKDPKKVMGQIQDWFSGKVAPTAEGISEGSTKSTVHPLGVNMAVSQVYDKAKNDSDILYKIAGKIGENESVEIKGITSDLEKIVEDMKKDAPANILNPSFQTSLGKFNRLLSQVKGEDKPKIYLDSRGNLEPLNPTDRISANDLVDIKQAANEHYNSGKFQTKKDTPYLRLLSKTGEAIKKTSLEFQKAIGKADDGWTELSRKFRDNPVLKKFWDPEDYHAFQHMKSRAAEGKPALDSTVLPETKARVEGLLDKIKSPSDLDSLKDALPPQDYDYLRAQKFNQIMSKTGLDAEALEKNYPMLVKSLSGNHEAIAALDAMKTVIEQMNERGVGNINPAALAKNENLLQRSLRTVMSLATGHKLYAIKHAIEAVKEEPAGVIQQRVTNYAKELQKGAPKKQYIPGVIPKIINDPAASGIGKEVNE